MQKSKSLSELKKDAINNKSESIKELIELGNTYWYRGCPVDAPDEVIALRLENGITIQLNEKDIIDVKKQDKLYMVQVKEGTNFMASFQMTAQVGSQKESCGCDSHSTSEKEGESQTGTIPSSMSKIFDDDLFQRPGLGVRLCWGVPYVTEKCYTYTNNCGKLERYCIPYITTRQVCRDV